MLKILFWNQSPNLTLKYNACHCISKPKIKQRTKYWNEIENEINRKNNFLLTSISVAFEYWAISFDFQYDYYCIKVIKLLCNSMLVVAGVLNFQLIMIDY